MLKISHISKTFNPGTVNEKKAIEDLSLELKKGDIVAVEANPGHDIGVVTLTGRLVELQIKKANLKSADDIKRIYRIAKPVDMDKYYEAK